MDYSEALRKIGSGVFLVLKGMVESAHSRMRETLKNATNEQLMQVVKSKTGTLRDIALEILKSRGR